LNALYFALYREKKNTRIADNFERSRLEEKRITDEFLSLLEKFRDKRKKIIKEYEDSYDDDYEPIGWPNVKELNKILERHAFEHGITKKAERMNVTAKVKKAKNIKKIKGEDGDKNEKYLKSMYLKHNLELNIKDFKSKTKEFLKHNYFVPNLLFL